MEMIPLKETLHIKKNPIKETSEWIQKRTTNMLELTGAVDMSMEMIPLKETLHIKKKPIKETYDWVQKRPIHVSKRHLWKRLLCITKRPVKETYGWVQKRPIKVSKRVVCMYLKETCVAVVGALANAVDRILFAAVIAREQALAWHLVCMYVCIYVCVCVCARAFV